MTFSRRFLIPGILISLPVVFAATSIALAQSPGAPQLPQESVVVDFATPTPTPTPTPEQPLPAPSAVPVVPPATGDDDADDVRGDDGAADDSGGIRGDDGGSGDDDGDDGVRDDGTGGDDGDGDDGAGDDDGDDGDDD